ncbi:tRNA preQ1(34) S-adenosylmethionine ribosyltransferase-isomerase QueA [Pseudovibrio sp. Tun.PSC04-5.I4]|uniref:tRNA preQ1(34) S-adenosylmethionine ribosyltransferase-isomerase QueA n=1 Tax=Pseudovibrio sp. Tun.PSC04-5.I4 TaxID=1798213 RepID=UPI00088625F2|nr:tRNA preQ1(34) S-adenosylmethionine ribosyltransferase-isomerase QueA [Pseudovibrio sp. Tun.PSC04-5.I4]SDR04068.1 S-adenosylmethionine:tRNA ribosyltransferase-isomerase [Pseudovibrio sp. Tun.PSC04-5.I4]
MLVDDFDFDLPPENIALRPASPRDSSRLLVVRPDHDPLLTDDQVRSLPDLLEPGDALVFNDTKVIPAQLLGFRTRDGVTAKVGVTLHQRASSCEWRAFVKPAKKLKVGDMVRFAFDEEGAASAKLGAEVLEKSEAGDILFRFDHNAGELDAAIAEVGHIPLPPYIAAKRAEDDQDRRDYQTVYAKHEGAVAAPTAGLHFTDELLARLQARGIEKHFVTLHVGAGTFLPVKVDNTKDHKMHYEWGEVSADTAAALNNVRKRGNKVVSVGTTSLRILETAADEDGVIQPISKSTDIFITPGYRFRAIDALMTNFHLPKSTLFMLVSAFSGFDEMHKAYGHAIENGYRFYSYGDSSLLFAKA